MKMIIAKYLNFIYSKNSLYHCLFLQKKLSHFGCRSTFNLKKILNFQKSCKLMSSSSCFSILYTDSSYHQSAFDPQNAVYTQKCYTREAAGAQPIILLFLGPKIYV